MTGRSIVAITAVFLFCGACATTTSHRLALTDDDSFKCEAQCRRLATENNAVDRVTYAACLDTCPGTISTPAAPCPPPEPSAVCVETTKRAGLRIVGMLVAVAVVGLLLLLVSFGQGLAFA